MSAIPPGSSGMSRSETDAIIGHGAILRGDYGSIRLGAGTAIEENAVIHIRPDGLSVLGERVTVGHGAILHGDLIDDFAVIGMGAVLSLNVVVGKWAIVGEGTVLPSNTRIEAEKFVAGVPWKVMGDVQPRHKEFWTWGSSSLWTSPNLIRRNQAPGLKVPSGIIHKRN